MKILIYDCEIVNAVPDNKVAPLEGIRYCDGWHDFAGMGVSVICAYDWTEGYRVFLADNFEAFKALAGSPDTLLVGFGNHFFDDPLIAACLGLVMPKDRSWDLYGAFRAARGAANTVLPGHGPSLDTLCRANFLEGKSGSGAFAPILWQKGKVGQVIDYCLGDVLRTKQLIELVMAGRLRDPDTGRIVPVPRPQFSEHRGAPALAVS